MVAERVGRLGSSAEYPPRRGTRKLLLAEAGYPGQKDVVRWAQVEQRLQERLARALFDSGLGHCEDVLIERLTPNPGWRALAKVGGRGSGSGRAKCPRRGSG